MNNADSDKQEIAPVTLRLTLEKCSEAYIEATAKPHTLLTSYPVDDGLVHAPGACEIRREYSESWLY